MKRFRTGRILNASASLPSAHLQLRLAAVVLLDVTVIAGPKQIVMLALTLAKILLILLRLLSATSIKMGCRALSIAPTTIFAATSIPFLQSNTDTIVPEEFVVRSQ